MRRVPAFALASAIVLVSTACSFLSSSHGPTVSVTPTVSTGRILLGIENGSQPSIAYIDASGMHPIAAPADPRMAQWAWGGPDSVLFTSELEKVRHVFRMALGKDPVMIDLAASAQADPRMSPDGSMIVFEEYDPETGRDLGLHVANADGSDVRRITPAAPDGATWGYDEPSFSPDGKWVTFSRVSDWEMGRAAIFVVRSDGSGLRRLTTYKLDAGSPRWSPDGTTILFTQGVHATDNGAFAWPLWTVPAAGGRPSPLPRSGAGWSSEGDWSPDGTEIVYTYVEAGWDHNQLRIMSADGSNDRVLWTSPSGSTAETPDW